MATGPQKIVPHLWFDRQAEEAAQLYTSTFKDSRTGSVTRYTSAGFETHHMPEGMAMTVDFEVGSGPVDSNQRRDANQQFFALANRLLGDLHNPDFVA